MRIRVVKGCFTCYKAVKLGGRVRQIVIGVHLFFKQIKKNYAPVLSLTAARLLTSMAIDDKLRLKQTDCKNVFCNGILPEDEICIVKPPAKCPRSTRGTFWKLNKNKTLIWINL